MQRVEVRWTDSGTFHGEGWVNSEDVPRLIDTQISQVVTTGYLVHEGEDEIYIGLSHTYPEGSSTGVYGVQTILKKNIISVHILAFMSDETERFGIPRKD